MKKPEAKKLVSAGASPKKPYHAPKLRDHGTLARLTAKGSAGSDSGAKRLP